jgi:hypothetical protein
MAMVDCVLARNRTTWTIHSRKSLVHVGIDSSVHPDISPGTGIVGWGMTNVFGKLFSRNCGPKDFMTSYSLKPKGCFLSHKSIADCLELIA